jgi:DNA-binding IclR family transcriptional regulator
MIAMVRSREVTEAVGGPMPDARTPGVPRNQSLKRAVAVLRAVAQQRQPATTTEVAAAAALPRATTSRLLATLADAGLVDRPPGGSGWILGYEATRLGRAADPYGVLIRRAQAPLDELTARTGESSVLAVIREPLEIEIVSQVDAPNLLRATSWIGRRFGLHASVSGKLAYARLEAGVRDALLREQPFDRYTEHTIVDRARFREEIETVRRDGHARSVDELELGLTMIGVEVPSAAARSAIASVGIMGPTSRILPAIDRMLEEVRATARALSALDW